MTQASAPGRLGECFLAQLRESFPGHDFAGRTAPGALVEIESPHPEVGRLQVCENPYDGELTVNVGHFTHVHFACHDDGLDADARQAAIAGEAVRWLRDMLADRLEFYGNGRGGGVRIRDGSKRGWLHRWMFGARTYVWSGPLDDRP